jgi:hypothetical protein
MNTKSVWGNMLQQKAVSNFPLKHLQHTGSNPMFAEHVEKAFQVHPAKVKLTAPGETGVGSPWQAMLKGKK